MATLNVSWLGGVEKGVAKGTLGHTPLTTSGTTAKTTTNPGANIAVVWSDVAHFVKAGPSASVEATTTNGLLVPANSERHIALNPGDEVAAITV